MATDPDPRLMSFRAPESLATNVRVALDADGSIRAVSSEDVSIGVTRTNGAGGRAIVLLHDEPVEYRAGAAFPAGEWLHSAEGGEVFASGWSHRKQHYALQRSARQGDRIMVLARWSPPAAGRPQPEG
jgi:hypothetical protein